MMTKHFPLGFGEIVQPQIIITSETYSSSSQLRGATGALQRKEKKSNDENLIRRIASRLQLLPPIASFCWLRVLLQV
ncbi:hypothetical protein Ddc_03964 [Ditylenchus destructor]|nr:hypothetical protein Ddc_03964 [Ditylenchus destructor]